MDKEIKKTIGESIDNEFNKQFEIPNLEEILKKEKEQKENKENKDTVK